MTNGVYSSSSMNKSRDPHRWLVFLATYMDMVLIVGFLYSIGVLFVEVMDAFGTNRAETAVVQSTSMAVTLGSGLVNGIVINKFGLVKAGLYGASMASIGIISSFFATSVLHLTISIGIIMAIGVSCTFIASSTAIGQHFTGKQRLLMLSIQSSGAGVGGMIYPFLLRYLSDLYGFHGALLIVGGCVLNLIPGCLLFKKVESTGKLPSSLAEKLKQFQEKFEATVVDTGQEIKIERRSFDISKDVQMVSQFPVLSRNQDTKTVVVQMGEKQKDNNRRTFFSRCSQLTQLLKNRSYVLFVLGIVITTPSISLIIVFIVDIFLDKGFTRDDASVGLTLLNVTLVFGRLLPGLLMQSKYISTLALPIFAAILAAVSLFLLTVVRAQWLTVTVCALIGLPMGMFVTMLSVVPLKIVGQERLPTAIGMIFTANCIGNAVVGPISGFIRDLTGSYSIPFIAAAAVNIVGTVLFSFAVVTQKKRKREHRRRSSVFYLTSL